MYNTKATEILRGFSKTEIKSFEKFINSPYFAKRRDIRGFFAELKKYYPDFEIEPQMLFEKLYPATDFSEIKLKNQSAQLIKLANEFLAHEALKDDSILTNNLVAKEYRKRNNERLFWQSLKGFELDAEKKIFNSIDCFNEEEKIERLKEDFFSSRNEFNKSISAKLNYSEHFTISFLIRFLRILRDKVITSTYNIPFESPLLESVFESIDFDNLLQKLRRRKYPLLWLLEIYYYVYKSVIDLDDDSSFIKLKNTFFENIDRFSATEKYFLFNDLIDACSFREHRGKLNYRNEEFEIYKEMFKQKAYSASESDYLSMVLFRNVLLLGLSLKEYDWLNEFIDNFTLKLKPEYRQNMTWLAMANIYFEKGEFEKALQAISKVEYDFFLFKTDVKNLMLKIYYELNLFEAAFSLVDAFKHFLAETGEIEEVYKKQYVNFLAFYNRLLKAKSDGSSKDAGFILFQINKTESLSSRKWLINKAEELIKVLS